MEPELPAPVSPPIRGRRPAAVRWVLLLTALGLLAFAVRLTLMLRGGGLLGIGGYDDGVYYSAADALLHGRLPYRDFLFLQPPGVVLAALPFAWIGTLVSDPVGFMAARIAFMLVGAVSTVVIAAILRRFGVVAAAVGGGFYALSYLAAYAERSVLLEPIATLSILFALLVLSRPALRDRLVWPMAAGAALGVACGFKIWYVVPAVIIVAAAGRSWWKLLVGAAVGGLAVYLPFFLVDPAAMFGQVVVDQVGRGQTAASTLARIYVILGEPGPIHLGGLSISVRTVTAIVGVAMLIAVALALTMKGARVYVLLFAADVVVLLSTPSFFVHYAALSLPMQALVVGAAAGRIARWMRARAGAAVLAVVLIGAFAVLAVPRIAAGVGVAVPLPGLRQAAAKVDGCIMTDDATVLIPMDALSRQLAAGCPLWPDLTGWSYDADRDVSHGLNVRRVQNAAWQARAVGYLSSGSAVILVRPATGLDVASVRRLTAGDLLFHDGAFRLYATR